VNVDEAVPRAGDVVVPVLVLLGVGDEEQVVDVLDVERGVAGREARILEGTGPHDRPEILVEDVDRAAAEIGGLEEAAAGGGGGGGGGGAGWGGGGGKVNNRGGGGGWGKGGRPGGGGGRPGGQKGGGGVGPRFLPNPQPRPRR